MVGFRDYDRTTRESYMRVFPSEIQESICGSYLSKQHETRVS